MPTAADLDRLRALVERLSPLATARPGEPVGSEGWNTVVGALIELTRAVLGEERGEAVPPHSHIDQVKSSWLDPGLRAIIEKGGLSEPGAATTVLKLEQSVRRLDDRLRAVDGGLGSIRDRMSEFATRDLVREADVTRLNRGLDSVALAPEAVRDLRRSLDAIAPDVKAAVAAAERLTVNGEPVDLADWNGRIATLEGLRDGLIGAEGEPLTATVLEKRLTELRNTLVTEDELDEAFASRPIVVPDERVDALADTLRVDLRSDISADLVSLETRLRGETNARFSDVETLVARRVAEATPALEQRIRAQVRTEMQAADAALRDELLIETDRRRSADINGLDQRTGERFEAVQSSQETVVRGQLDRLLPARLQGLETRIGDALARIGGTEGKLLTIERALADTDRRLADETRSVRQQVGSVRDALRQGIAGLKVQVDQDQRALEARMVATTTTRIDERTNALAKTLRTEFRGASTGRVVGGDVLVPVRPIRGPQ